MEKQIQGTVNNIKTGTIAYNCTTWKRTTDGQQIIEGTSLTSTRKVYWLAKNCKISVKKII